VDQGREFQDFLALLRERKALAGVLALLSWDEQVNLPLAAAQTRSDQTAAVAKAAHEKNTDPRYVELLQKLRSTKLPEEETAIVRETWREVERALKVPDALVHALSQAESRCYSTWVEARRKNSFAVVRPVLEELFRLKREYGNCIRGERPIYDAFLDLHEPGLTATVTEKMFTPLGSSLSELLQQIIERGRSGREKPPFTAALDKQKQRELCVEVASLMGFDFHRGRLDETVHPFCSEIGFDDIRMTTRYFENDICPALFGTMHETGHALYELGFLPEWRATPIAEFCSMGIHESQSRLWENMVGRSRGFLRYLYPKMTERFPEAMNGVRFDDFYNYVNRVGPSLIRVEADEVSYGLHVIIRFELEQALFAGDVSFDDLPLLWKEKYRKYLGVTPSDELQGVLQDVHWYIGAFGYFPTYLLGSAYAAQIYAAAAREIPALDDAVAAGELLGLRAWLRTKIHIHGRRYEAHDLLQRATGESPNGAYYLKYLRGKYLAESDDG